MPSPHEKDANKAAETAAKENAADKVSDVENASVTAGVAKAVGAQPERGSKDAAESLAAVDASASAATDDVADKKAKGDSTAVSNTESDAGK